MPAIRENNGGLWQFGEGVRDSLSNEVTLKLGHEGQGPAIQGEGERGFQAEGGAREKALPTWVS